MLARNTVTMPMPDAASAELRRRGGGVLGLIAAIFAGWTEAQRERRDLERLQAMPDHMLCDIGLTRDDLRPRARGALRR